MKLRPVTFVYKSDLQAEKQYGLIAEEVGQVYPELVVHDSNGKVESVRYSMLTSMLLNELQKQAAKSQRLSTELKSDKATMQTEIAALKASNEVERAKRIAIEARLADIERTVIARGSGHGVQAAFNR